ncbi:hypothetical protein I350_07093 [Cryptococcus amylolentus CBS 6273]|uniref:Uncharacterized protein n=1 Tax=Cryptococcus amylolentus CBS 6273 TaxID=1296118 RepID=A0A1E3JDL9_9TREE|nr:hypothetical protein I350_07093 [Cryptococcus amylolentus CBS 6273]
MSVEAKVAVAPSEDEGEGEGGDEGVGKQVAVGEVKAVRSKQQLRILGVSHDVFFTSFIPSRCSSNSPPSIFINIFPSFFNNVFPSIFINVRSSGIVLHQPPRLISRWHMLVLGCRELIAVILTACLTWADVFHGWISGLFEYIARQDQDAYDKWIQVEFDRCNARGLSLEGANQARNEAKQDIDAHRAGTFWVTAIIPTFVFILSVVVYLVGKGLAVDDEIERLQKGGKEHTQRRHDEMILVEKGKMKAEKERSMAEKERVEIEKKKAEQEVLASKLEMWHKHVVFQHEICRMRMPR